MLNWATRFNIFCFLDNNNYSFEDPAFEYMLAAGASETLPVGSDSMNAIKEFSTQHPGWLFGHFGYPSSISRGDETDHGFPLAFFFSPRILLRLTGNQLTIESGTDEPADVFTEIGKLVIPVTATRSVVQIQSRYKKEEYLSIIREIQKHIRRGDCYELNFCQDFFAKNAELDPLHVYLELAKVSPNPFAAFYKLEDKYCICASPERFLRRTGNVVISQPIKGTAKRNLFDKEADLANRQYLRESEKEKAENVMIVDLVRNDLSRVCEEGSVIVKELFGIYSFPQVHQMISTVQGTVDADTHWTAIIEACFPVGSMTGAPKIKVMELIDRYEKVPRGLFSGCIGYVDPSGNFDFNVVIRSLFYNSSKRVLSFHAGGGITFYSDPEKEYEESLLKASAILKILS